jgi:hypothetical protein
VRYRHDGRPRKPHVESRHQPSCRPQGAARRFVRSGAGARPRRGKKAAKAKAAAARADTVKAFRTEYLTRDGKRLRIAATRETILRRLVYPGVKLIGKDQFSALYP